MNLRFAIVVATLLGTTSVFSAVHLSTPEEIQVVSSNDQEVNAGLLRKNQTYQLDSGINNISLRYTEFFQHNDNSHDILKSGIVTVKSSELKEGENYRLALINAPQNFDDAKKYKDQPVIGLYDAKNQLLVQQAGAKENAKPLLGSNIFTKSIDLTTKTVTPTNQPAAVYTQAAVIPQKAKTNTDQAGVNPTVDKELIQLWQKASKTERQKFMSWVADQAN